MLGSREPVRWDGAVGALPRALPAHALRVGETQADPGSAGRAPRPVTHDNREGNLPLPYARANTRQQEVEMMMLWIALPLAQAGVPVAGALTDAAGQPLDGSHPVTFCLHSLAR